MPTNELTTNEILNFIPQQKPFRFVDEILTIDQHHIVGTYTFKHDESFYSGHFPNKPVTPGVILLECMCQIGVVALGIYLFSLEFTLDQLKNELVIFTDAEVEFIKQVYPGDQVLVTGKKIFWRRKKLRSYIEMHDKNGNLVATATASGLGVKNQ